MRIQVAGEVGSALLAGLLVLFVSAVSAARPDLGQAPLIPVYLVLLGLLSVPAARLASARARRLSRAGAEALGSKGLDR